MKIRIVLIIMLFVALFQCSSDKEDVQLKMISGKWLFAHDVNITSYDKDGVEFPPLPPRENLGYNFFSKDSCESNFPFFLVDFKGQSDQEFIFERDVKKNLGRKTKYRIEKDSLKIYDKTFDKWKSYKIILLDENNLILNDQDVIIKNFVRKLKN